MDNEYSLAHLTVLGCAPPEMIYIAARAGYDYVSPRLIPMGLPGERNYSLVDNPELLRQTRVALSETGVRLHDIELVRITDDVELGRYVPAFELAAELGARAVLTSIWTPDRARYVAKFGELCDLARPFGLTVDLEYVPIASVARLSAALDVLDSARRDNAGLMVDMHHFHRARDSLDDLARVPRWWFHFAHLCDAPADIPADRGEMVRVLREARLDVGTGGIDVAGILGRMPRVVLSIEQPNVARVKEMGYAEHAARCLEAARTYFGSHANAEAEPA